MPRYYFNFRDDRDVVNDVEGSEFDSFELAVVEAFNAAQEMWHDRLVRHEDPRKCAFEITDAAGTALTVVPFTEVLESCRRRSGAPGSTVEAPTVEAKGHVDRYSQLTEAYPSSSKARTLSRDIGLLLRETSDTIARAREFLKRSPR